MADNVSTLILSVSWAETALGLVFYILRFISNWRFVRRFRWDFALASATVAIQVIAQIALQLSVNSGMGHHMHTLDGPNIVSALRWGWVYQLLAIAASTLGKLAILAFLVQIRGWQEKKPWALLILGALIAAVNIAVLGTILGQCQPMAKLWDDSLDGACDPGRENNQNYSFFQASFNAFSDALMATYPAYLFWKLQMKRRVKIGLSILMGLGWIAAVCSGIKCYELEALTTTDDVTYALHQLLIWASTESWIVVIVGCVPPCRPLMEKALQILGLSSTKKSSNLYNDQSNSAYAKFGTDRSRRAHWNVQANAYGGRSEVGRDDDLDWVELTAATGENSSKEKIVPGDKGVVVTTDIMTQVEDAPHALGSLDHGHVFGDDSVRK